MAYLAIKLGHKDTYNLLRDCGANLLLTNDHNLHIYDMTQDRRWRTQLLEQCAIIARAEDARIAHVDRSPLLREKRLQREQRALEAVQQQESTGH